MLELGANIGINLHALRALQPHLKLAGLELNPDAYRKLASAPFIQAHEGSLLTWQAPQSYDLVFTSGVLIHIDPASLAQAYAALYEPAKRFILIAEYYSPSPVEVNYRGHQGKLFKRDFAGELLARYPSLQLVDYGFVYRGDPTFPMDDITWFLLQKA